MALNELTIAFSVDWAKIHNDLENSLSSLDNGEFSKIIQFSMLMYFFPRIISLNSIPFRRFFFKDQRKFVTTEKLVCSTNLFSPIYKQNSKIFQLCSLGEVKADRLTDKLID